ncbi:Protein NATD1 [Halotydeus destructor]|nr:Protein NATD1 [Halotydeus destructor]
MSFITRVLGRNQVRGLIHSRETFMARLLSTDKLHVEHNEKDREFFIKTNNDKAVLNYEFIGKDKVDLYHTEVPDVYRGQGVAKLLAQSAFDFVVDKDLKMKLSCTYLQKFLKENPEERYLKRLV